MVECFIYLDDIGMILAKEEVLLTVYMFLLMICEYLFL